MVRPRLLKPLILTTLAAAAGARVCHGLAGQPDAGLPASQHLREPERVREYERAVAREREQEAVVTRLAALHAVATDTVGLALQGTREVDEAARAAERRAQLVAELAASAAETVRSKTDALAAIERLRVASAEAHAAAAAYGAAPPADRWECASRTDAAADGLTVARNDARRAVSVEAATTGSLLSTADKLRYWTESFLDSVATAERATGRMTEQAAAGNAGVEAGTPSGALPAELLERMASLAPAAAALDRDADALSDPVRKSTGLIDDVCTAISRERDSLHTLRVFLDAEVDYSVERDAEGIISALYPGALASCGRSTSSRARLTRDLTTAKTTSARARAGAAVAQRAAAASVAAMEKTRATARAAVEPAKRDASALTRLAAGTDAFQRLASEIEESLWGAYKQAFEEYDRARRAADTAYLAAYGQPRVEVGLTLADRGLPPPPPPPPAAAAPAPPPPAIADHAWEFFTRQEPESDGYGAYTYVLFRYRIDDDLAAAIRQRYRALLTAIAKTTLPSAAVQPGERASFNLFSVPGWKRELGKDASGHDLLANYDTSLSLSYLSRAGRGAIQRKDILKALQSSPGPFLLTTLTKIESAATTSSILFVDLSQYQPQLFPDLLAAYKQSIQAAPLVRQQVWKPGPVFVVGSFGLAVGSSALQLSEALGSVISFLTSGGAQAAHAAVQ